MQGVPIHHPSFSRSTKRFTTAAWLVLSLFAAVPAAAFDLTGHWEGSWTCSGIEAGQKWKDVNRESTIAITDFGNGVIAARVDNSPWLGIAIYAAGNTDRGEVAMAHCGSDANPETGSFTELARFRVSTSGDRGTLSGISIYSSGSLHVSTCQYRLTRVDTVNPGLAYSCP
jgi:hypothetical protein